MMRGKTIVVTGANSGIEKAAAAELLKLQARVTMACREQKKEEDAAREIRQEAGPSQGEVVVKHLDLASLKSVHSFCEEILQEELRLDVLIKNAGVFQCTQTDEGFEMQFGVNHLGHFLLTTLLLDLLTKSAPSRIVVVTSKLYKYASPLEGAQTPLYLACAPEVEGINGRCFANCEDEELLPKATDKEVARKLWEISEIMVGLTK
ncbi:hypothetical protein ANANG_G00119220 [Anguilla anguilla]|uniref:Uncharacterized protein n=1 Tax=Anguilla anguilla TaxID=7936 RepID=A0A9D3S1G0_ANGAN|nr:hypothetical protein ANANG_G00119220 [Anguilla anguilla]